MTTTTADTTTLIEVGDEMEAFEKIRNKVFEIDFLMIVAAVGAAFLGEWADGALLLFLF